MSDTELPPEAAVTLEGLTFRSAHGLLRGCEGRESWRNAGEPCSPPDWTPAGNHPVSHTGGEKLRLELLLTLQSPGEGTGPLALLGKGPQELTLARQGISLGPGSTAVEVVSARPLEKRIAKLSLEIRWSLSGGATLSPDRSGNLVYVTMGRPREDRQDHWQEDGVTLKRMDRAVTWVEPMHTTEPHAIIEALMAKFPHYALRPSPEVPRVYHHPTYFNNAGGAWPMSDHVAASGECQAIVRLIRGILRQLGVPGKARVLVVWGDPEIDGGRKAVSADWEERPSGGLDRTKMVNGQRWLATLVDEAVEEGKTYPASSTPQPDGGASPGFNRYEACLEFTHGGKTRYYAGGAGVLETREAVLTVFWGLVWVTPGPNEGFKVEKIVARYGEGES